MSASATIVWFRQDLRVRDNPALHAAAANGGPVIPVYVWSPREEGDWGPGSASCWWLHHSLVALRRELEALGSRLVLATGNTLSVLKALAARTGATAVHWNKRYEPAAAACSRTVLSGLRRNDISAVEFNGSLLTDPERFLNQSGRPYQVYTPFQRALMHVLEPGTPLQRPRILRAPSKWPRSVRLESLELLPRIKWYETMAASWTPGEAGAKAALEHFLSRAIDDYRQLHDVPAVEGTSRLSPHLHFGEIGPRQIWHALGPRGRSSPFCRQILWREFGHHLLHHFPHTANKPLRPEFQRFPWRRNQKLLRAWQHGRTGIPLVDAGMRELWATGWMHNRVRLVVGSFLVKNLLIPWQEGARWFWDTLLDADLANNTLNWQWVAGCGADAAPYFRIFNPETQAQRFDPHGEYVRRWIPEISQPARYPPPVVDLGASRDAALDAYKAMRRAAR